MPYHQNKRSIFILTYCYINNNSVKPKVILYWFNIDFHLQNNYLFSVNRNLVMLTLPSFLFPTNKSYIKSLHSRLIKINQSLYDSGKITSI